MERAESKGEDAPAVTTERTDPAEAKGGAVTVSASDEAKETTEDIPSATDAVIVVEETKAAAPAEPPSENRSKQRKRRLAVLQDDVDVETSETKEGGAAPRQLPPLKCVIDGDANMMATGAEECTTLNSDEDPSLQDEPESEDDSDNDDEEWVEDWNIGELTDEEMDEEEAPLPDSVCLTAARNKKAMSMMKTHGWEYDPNKFGSDPTYAGFVLFEAGEVLKVN
ncbi:Pleiotropic drug resistance protein [Phytophthora cinnamomi]|uniref:Pleiotropic drug resistance protein n=1 Tax=Phytophthora cinnamomi TaxID=4785 RepID=UPI0035596C16|nr:Pleiotropic drug resistance protein [Phytophthora cinnamomi]